MSGLCGWFSRAPAALPIEQMAAPLCRFEQAPLRIGSHSVGTVALAGGTGGASLYQEDGLLIAHWGERPDALARLWRAHGPHACEALSGHFSFAILDERRGEALLAVDRCATRPLFYQLVGHTLLFATSADALAMHPGASRELDAQSLYNYLHLHAVSGPDTMYKGQRRLAPGEYVHLHGGRLDRARYWRLRFHEHEPGALPELRSELRDTMRSAIEAGLGQQRVGVMLSGGAGSAAVASLAQDLAERPVPTVTVASGPGAASALAGARRVARALHTEHHERTLGPSEAADVIPKLAAAFDQPCGDPAALALFYGALTAREAGVQRLMSGQGGSVLFGRRAAHSRHLRLSRYERLPSALRQLLLEPLLFKLAGSMQTAALTAARAHIVKSLQPLPERLRQATLLHRYGADQVFEPAFLARVDITAPQAAQEQAWWAGGRDPVNRMIALDMQYALHDLDLPTLVRACALAGVEAGVPYLHDGVVAFAARLDPVLKTNGDARRGLFRTALRAAPSLPLATPGAGLAVPFGQWLQTDARLRALAFDSLADLRRRRIVRADFIDSLLTRHVPAEPARHGTMVWLLMMLEQWFAQRRVDSVQHNAVPARVPAHIT